MSGHEQPAAPATGVPPRIGRYDILGPIATGGMAEILLARLAGPHGFERVVALKRVLPHFARDESFVRMFIDEARIVSGLNHPNVVQVVELGQADGELYLAMEYLEGEPLSGLMRRTRTRGTHLPLELATYIIAEAAAGLHAAHELKSPDGTPRNLVHRDVSPQNIFITYDGQVKVIDFGIAKAADRITRTQTGELKGKQAYMSPEQTRLGPLDRRSDLFSLGVVLWETSLGRRLFDRGTVFDTLSAIRACDVTPPTQIVVDYPTGLEKIVLHALAERPDARPQSAAELRAALLDEARSLNLPADPKVALASWMRQHFDDRIEHKAAVIRNVREGARVSMVPAAEVDLSAELSPIVSAVRVTQRQSSPSAVSSAASAQVPAAPARSALVLKLGVGMVVAALVAIGLALGLADKAEEAPSPPPEPQVAAELEVSEAVRAEPPPVQPDVVAIDIVTTPDGAEVVVDSEVLGLTPTTVELPRGAGQVELELRRQGYETAVESVQTDRDVRIRVALTAVPEVATPRIRPGSVRPSSIRPSSMRTSMRPTMMTTVSMTSDPPPFGRLD